MKQNVDLLKSLMADDNDDDEVEKDNNSDKEEEKVPCDVGLRTLKIPQRQKICQILWKFHHWTLGIMRSSTIVQQLSLLGKNKQGAPHHGKGSRLEHGNKNTQYGLHRMEGQTDRQTETVNDCSFNAQPIS